MYKEPGAYTNIDKKDLEEEVRYVVAIDNTAPTTSKNKVWSINKINAEFANQNEVQKVSSDLQNVKTSKADISVVDSIKNQINSITILAKEIGLIKNSLDSAAANTTILNKALKSNHDLTILFENDLYYFDNTITLISKNKLEGKTNTILKFTNNVDCIILNPFSQLEHLAIETSSEHTKSCIKLCPDCDFTQWNNSNTSFIRDIFIKGTLKSKGLDCSCNDGFNISNFNAIDVTIINCEYGIYVSANGKGWANGNNFINVYPQNCKYGIYNLGGGNKFIHTIQFGDQNTSFCGIVTGGGDNVFVGKIWDALIGQKLIKTLPNSFNNVFLGQTFTPNLFNFFIDDFGKDNDFSGQNIYSTLSEPQGSYNYNGDEVIVPSWSKNYGSLSNTLWYIDKTDIVKITADNGINYGNADMLFGGQGCIFNNTDPTKPIIIEINFNEARNFVSTIGLNFFSGMNAKNIKIETSSSDSVEFSILKEITENKLNKCYAVISAYGGVIKKIKLTIHTGTINSITNPTGRIAIGEIFMFQNGFNSNKKLDKKGDCMYGDFEMKEGNIILKSADNSRFKLVINNDGTLSTTKI